MAIRSILINTPDVAQSAVFYQRYLGAEPVGEPTAERAVLDLVTATIELRHVTHPDVSTWATDDLVKGFRHVGFKVAEVDNLVTELKAAGVPFHLDPIEAEGGVRITFFYAPEGTLLELVQRELEYTVVHDANLVARERALGIPERPRFDHIALTVEDLPATEEFYGPLGFNRHGTIEQPHDARGFHIDYLKGGDTVLEIFTYDVPTRQRAPQLNASGFLAAVVDVPESVTPLATSSVGELAGGATVVADPNGFPLEFSREDAVA